jgi:hypothetical protein
MVDVSHVCNFDGTLTRVVTEEVARFRVGDVGFVMTFGSLFVENSVGELVLALPVVACDVGAAFDVGASVGSNSVTVFFWQILLMLSQYVSIDTVEPLT